ncbi:hypothetical protein V498_08455 [Pseudogymnoascus sp. VKM F-4517 (FW-2822)]|nr:hypothetical protein V498_08455 [Pseudogymnoascus sp. VKM F-4517 (FW-2822)]
MEITLEKLDQSINDAVERAALEDEKASIVASLEIAQNALKYCQLGNTNVIENNESRMDAIQAILTSEKYLIHAKGNKAKDHSSQLIGDVDSATVQKALQDRRDKTIEMNTKGQIEISVPFSNRYGAGNKLGQLGS